jgi:negative regulator of sigma E activity
MTDHFEDELRRALRPLPAPAGFAARVLRNLPEQRASATVTPIALARPAAPPQRNYWRTARGPAALAASLVLAVLLGQQMAMKNLRNEDAAGRAASQEVMQALRVTSKKLDLAYQAVKNPPEAAAEENPS